MTGDGNIGGDKVICDKGCIEQQKATRKAKHFTVIGIINLPGQPICCVVIIEGKHLVFDIQACIDLSKVKVGDKGGGEEYFRMNVGSSKYHPVGTTCTY